MMKSSLVGMLVLVATQNAVFADQSEIVRLKSSMRTCLVRWPNTCGGLPLAPFEIELRGDSGILTGSKAFSYDLSRMSGVVTMEVIIEKRDGHYHLHVRDADGEFSTKTSKIAKLNPIRVQRKREIPVYCSNAEVCDHGDTDTIFTLSAP